MKFIDYNYELEKYLLANPEISRQYEQILIEDAADCELSLYETRQFVEECITSFEHFKMFMPLVAKQLENHLQ